jgi:vacuolar-type H+-ATPase subunit C/Vma6
MDELADLLSQLGQAGNDPYIVLLMVAAVLLSTGICFFVLAGSAGYLMILLTIASCAYPVARVKARGIPFINNERLEELLDAGMVPDALSRMQAAGFTLPGITSGDISGLENALEYKEMDEYRVLLGSIPTDFEPFFAQYEVFYEIRMIKRLLRMIQSRKDHEEILKRVLPVGVLTKELISQGASCSGVDECVHLFRGTSYSFLAEGPLRLYHENSTLLALEIALDGYGSSTLHQSCTLIRPGLAAPFRDLSSTLIDIQNVRTLLRAKHAGINPAEISPSLLNGGFRLPFWRLIQLNEMMSLPDIIGQLNGTGYDRILQPFLPSYPGQDSLIQFDLALDWFLLTHLAKISLMYYYTGGPLIWFLLAKEYEYRNLQVVLTGLAEGVDPAVIKNYLVCDTGAG